MEMAAWASGRSLPHSLQIGLGFLARIGQPRHPPSLAWIGKQMLHAIARLSGPCVYPGLYLARHSGMFYQGHQFAHGSGQRRIQGAAHRKPYLTGLCGRAGCRVEPGRLNLQLEMGEAMRELRQWLL